MENDAWNQCPYCKGNLKCISENVIGWVYATNCLFCRKKIYGSIGEDGTVGWTSEHPFKMMIISVVGAIAVTAVAAFFLLK